MFLQIYIYINSWHIAVLLVLHLLQCLILINPFPFRVIIWHFTVPPSSLLLLDIQLDRKVEGLLVFHHGLW